MLRRIIIEGLWLHVEGACRRLELRAVDAVLESRPSQIEVDIPHLSLSLAGILAGEIAAQRLRVLLKDAWHEALPEWQRLVFIDLLTAREIDDFLHLQVLQIHNRHRDINEWPRGALSSALVIRFRDHISTFIDADEFRVMRAFDLRRIDFDKPLHDDVARECGVPGGGEEALRRHQRHHQGEKGENGFHHGKESILNARHGACSAEMGGFGMVW